jgi:hypothetical protein
MAAPPPWSTALPAEWRWLTQPVGSESGGASGHQGGAGAEAGGNAAGGPSTSASCWTDILFRDEAAATAAQGARALPPRWDGGVSGGGGAADAAALLPERLVSIAAPPLLLLLPPLRVSAAPQPLPLPSHEGAPALRCLDRTHEPGCTRCARVRRGTALRREATLRWVASLGHRRGANKRPLRVRAQRRAHGRRDGLRARTAHAGRACLVAAALRPPAQADACAHLVARSSPSRAPLPQLPAAAAARGG